MGGGGGRDADVAPPPSQHHGLSHPRAGLAKVIPVLIGVMMPVAIFALTKLAVPLYVDGDR